MQLEIKLAHTNQEITSKIILFSSENLKEEFTKLFPESIFLIEKNIFQAKENEFYIFNHNEIIFYFVGIGTKNGYDSLQKTGKKFSFTLKEKLPSELELIFPDKFPNESKKGFLIGILLGTYQIKSKEKPKKITLFSEINPEINLKELTILATSQIKNMDLLNFPANHKNSEIIGNYVTVLAKELKVSCKILKRKECEKLGMGAYLAVNQASKFEPNFIILEYKPKNPDKKIGLVGKCVTFDTGGISIKPSTNMHHMKSDCGGAITVLGVFETLVRLKSKDHLIAIIPATDNVVDKDSYLPSEVVTASNGKTIEIIDTDAEGRLVLADALAYLSTNYKTDLLIDLATLTGSTVRMFGSRCASFFATAENTKAELELAGYSTGERVWNLPLWEDFDDDLKSDVADLKNYTGKPYSDAIYAAKFLQQFTNNHPNWIHLDIAGVAFTQNDYAKDESASGYGIQLLVDFITNKLERLPLNNH